MSKDDKTHWEALDWSWVVEWIGGMIEKWKSKGLSEEQIIAELSKYGDVKTIEGEN